MSSEGRGSYCAVARGKTFILAIGIASLLFSVAAPAEEKEKEPAAVFELGAAGAWNVGGSSTFGPTAAIEFESIKNYLVIEAGLTPFFDTGGRAEWDFDLLFRHSFELSKKVEFEPGIGPTLSSAGQTGAVAS